ncbi:hypothetical protein HFO17_12090 [Rhizobium laguerreae]|uniref:hypothetical protein n=1 Tax=Rhizobium laguerreae TaxID=1076926 RepID=UPI001C909390|nr:hypothetical protein [Rhizobium laguerreae]MBY3235277.1 hypothetical protein [Rhizobium laguerreae]
MEVPADLVERVNIGYAKRRATLKRLLRDGSDPRPSKDRAGFIDLRWVPRVFFINSLSYSENVQNLKNVIPADLRDLFVCYYYSSDEIDDVEALLNHDVSDEQFSVLVQSLVAGGKISDPAIRSSVADGINSLLNEFPGYYAPTALKAKIRNTFIRNDVLEFNSEISQIARYISLARGRSIHIFGPEIFSLFDKLLERSSDLTDDDLIMLYRISLTWGVEEAMIDLTELRSFRGLPSDKPASNFVSIHQFSSYDSQGPALERWREVRREFNKLHAAIQQSDGKALVNALIAIYNIDPQLVNWINWDQAYDCICDAPRFAGLHMAFFYLLASADEVGQLFPDVSLAVGEGAFDSALRGAFRPLSTREIPHLVAELKAISGPAGRALASAILRHETASNFSTHLNYDAPWARRLVQAQSLSFDGRAAAFRRDAARAFQKAKLIDANLSQRVQKEAETHLRVAYLRGRQLEGLVHINFEYARKHFNETYRNSIITAQRMVISSSSGADHRYQADVAELIADDFTRFLLINGPINLRTTISDSLRHGQLPNRFLQAFDKAIATTLSTAVDISNLINANSTSTDKLHWVVSLRSQLKECVLKFNQDFLSVQEGDPLFQKINRIVQDFVENSIRDKNSDDDKIWISAFKEAIEDVLCSARDGLVNVIYDFIELAEQVSIDEAGGPSSSVDKTFKRKSFIESLSQQLKEAIKDTSQWIALAQEGVAIAHFSLEDVVELCLVNYSPTGGRRPAMRVNLSRRRGNSGDVIAPPNVQINGCYFDLVETICKNLIGNCFAHSGLGLETRGKLEFVVSGGKIAVKFKNTLSPSAVANLRAKLPDLRKRASSITLDRAGEDESSGTAKMAWACNREFGAMPKITLDVDENRAEFNTLLEMQHIGRPFLVEL